MERIYGGHLCYGPPIENGFYYDMHSEDYRVNNFKVIELTQLCAIKKGYAKKTREIK